MIFREHPLAALALPLAAEVRAAVDDEKEAEQQVGILLSLARAYKTLGDTAGSRRERAEALARARRIPADKATPMLWPALAFDTDRLGDAAGARALLAEGLQRAKGVKGAPERYHALAWLAQMQGVLKNRTAMEATLAGLKKTDPKRVQSEEGRWMEATARASAGDLPGALRLAALLKPGQRAPLLAQIATRQVRQADRAGAKKTMALAFQAMAKETEAPMRQISLGILLGETVAQGNAVEAIRRAGKDPKLRQEVAEALLARGERERALVLDPRPSPTLVYAHAQAGEIDKARETMEKTLADRAYFMQDDPIRMLGAIAAALAKAGDKDRAAQTLDEARTKAKTPDEFFGDRRAVLLNSLLDSFLNRGWREASRN